MIKKILVTTDFSECGNEALNYAFELASVLGARVDVLYVAEREHHDSAYFIDFKPLDSEEHAKKVVRQSKEKMDEIIPKQWADKVEYKKHAIIDKLAHDGIIKGVEKYNPDLLVISSHGRSGFAKFLIGSTTDRVTRSVDCPVLVLKSKCEVKD